MSTRPPASGYFRSGLPFNRLGHGPIPLVVVQGLLFENKPQPRFALGPYAFLGERYTVFRETAAGIPGARLVLYPRMGHPAHGKRFKRDVLAFLTAAD